MKPSGEALRFVDCGPGTEPPVVVCDVTASAVTSVPPTDKEALFLVVSHTVLEGLWCCAGSENDVLLLSASERARGDGLCSSWSASHATFLRSSVASPNKVEEKFPLCSGDLASIACSGLVLRVSTAGIGAAEAVETVKDNIVRGDTAGL